MMIVEGTPVFLIESAEEANKIGEGLLLEKEVAIDFETDDNRNQYGRTICLMQLFDGKAVYLVDILKVGRQQIFIDFLESEKVAKLFHACSADLQIFKEEYVKHANFAPKNIHDTNLIHKFLITNLQDTGLKTLLNKYLGLTLDKEEQKSNWLLRPLREAQLIYAAKDVLHLLELKELMLKELEKIDRLSWYEQERKMLEIVAQSGKASAYEKYLYKLKNNPLHKEIFARFWEIRERLAKDINRPHFFVMDSESMVELAKNPPKNLSEWANVKKCHHMVKKKPYVEQFYEATQEALKMQLDRPVSRKKEIGYYLENSQRIDNNLLIRDRSLLLDSLLAASENHENQNFKQLLFTKQIVQTLLFEGMERSLRPWQQKLIFEICEKNDLDAYLLWEHTFAV